MFLWFLPLGLSFSFASIRVGPISSFLPSPFILLPKGYSATMDFEPPFPNRGRFSGVFSPNLFTLGIALPPSLPLASRPNSFFSPSDGFSTPVPWSPSLLAFFDAPPPSHFSYTPYHLTSCLFSEPSGIAPRLRFSSYFTTKW